MKFKYVGYSQRGLRHGQTYECCMDTRYSGIFVLWSEPGPFGLTGTRAYSSLAELVHDWEDVSE